MPDEVGWREENAYLWYNREVSKTLPLLDESLFAGSKGL